MNEIESYINRMFAGIPESTRKEEIRLEITQNLNEKVEDLVAQGQSREAAVRKAVDDFGDIDDLKEELEGSAKLAQSKKLGLSLAFSVWGTVLITALFLFINFYYTPDKIWFVYPTFAVAWWPLALFFQWFRNKKDVPVGFAFSVCGFVLIAGLMLFMNLYYTPEIIWFVYPVFAVIWWPLLTIFAGRPFTKVLSLIGSFLTIALLVLINYLTSWSYPWFLFPSFAILWWPLAMFLGTGRGKTFSIIGSLVIITSLIITNYVVSPSVIWFYYPVFAVIWWPLSVLLAGPRTIKAYSVVGALILAAFFTLENLLKSPFCPWALLTYFPILMWPVGILLGKRLGKLYIALFGNLAGILYYAILNMTVFPGFPWAIFPAYALLWWPLAVVAFAQRKRPLLFSVAGVLLSAAFFIAVNAVASPETIWAVYPIFALLWWPLAVYYFVYRGRDVWT